MTNSNARGMEVKQRCSNVLVQGSSLTVSCSSPKQLLATIQDSQLTITSNYSLRLSGTLRAPFRIAMAVLTLSALLKFPR
jgi:hypothetical protein